jgi:lipoate-protein ligase A
VHEDRGAADAALNMAIDEALLEHATLPTLRFYGWARPSLSFGYFGKFAEIVTEAERRDLVRRWTGGGSVLHGEDLTYALMTPASHPTSTLGPAKIYAALHAAIRDALRKEGRDVELAAVAGPKVSDACFANPVRDDVMMLGRKVAGAAQRRTRGGFLHQGSIQLPDLSESFRVRFAEALSERIERAPIALQIREQATVLAEEKYRTDAWLRRW